MLSVTVLALAVLSTTVTAARCRTDTPRCPNENGCTFTTQNGAMFELKCANDFDGNVIEITEAGTFADCTKSCGSVSDCEAFNYEGEFCYLLGDLPGTASTSTSVVSGLLIKAGNITTPSTAACTDPIQCDVPGTNDCTYSTNNGTFQTSCHTDFYGNDMEVTFSNDLSGCMNNCAATPRCLAVSWSTGTCYLKSAVGHGIYSPWVDGAYLR